MTDRPLQSRIRLAQLRLLIAVADTGSLFKAAKSLHISQPAATKALRQFEEAVQGIVVVRTGTGSSLTAFGHMLCKRARLILAELRNTEEELALWHAGRSGHIVVGAQPIATGYVIPQALILLGQIAPSITSTVIEGASDLMFDHLKSGRVELLVGCFYAGQDFDLSTETLYESAFGIAARSDHPLFESSEPLTWDAMLRYPWVLPPSGVRSRIALDALFRKERIRMPSIQTETSSYLVTRHMMLNSDVLCPMAVEIFREDVQHRLIRQIPFKLETVIPPVGVVWAKGGELSPAALSLMDALRTVSAEYQQRKSGKEILDLEALLSL